MIQRGYYSEIEKERITESVRGEGFDPICITDPPGRVYPVHCHAETKLLVFLKGGMVVKVGGRSYECHAGDRIIIQGNMEHSATVGSEGCIFLWSEKMESR